MPTGNVKYIYASRKKNVIGSESVGDRKIEAGITDLFRPSLPYAREKE